MNLEDIKNIINKSASSYTYAWIHCFDRLDIVYAKDIGNQLEDLIELRLFGENRELQIKRKNSLSKEFKEPKEWTLSKETNVIKEQQIISKNKSRKINEKEDNLIGKYGCYVLELFHEIDYEDDGQAYIKSTHMGNVIFKEYAKGMEE